MTGGRTELCSVGTHVYLYQCISEFIPQEAYDTELVALTLPGRYKSFFIDYFQLVSYIGFANLLLLK